MAMSRDEFMPMLRALPGTLGSLPQWWSTGIPPQSVEPELEPIEDFEARTGRFNFSTPPRQVLRPGPTPTPTATPTPASVFTSAVAPTPTPTPAPSQMLPPPLPTMPGLSALSRPSGPPGSPRPSPISEMSRSFGRWNASQLGPTHLAQYERDNPAPPQASPQGAGGMAGGAAPLVPNSPAPPPMMRNPGLPQFYQPPVAAASAPAAAPKPEPIRALRLPNGKMIFTNQGTSVPGAREISRRDAGAEIRSRAALGDLTAQMENEGAGASEGGMAADVPLAPNGMPFGFRQLGSGSSSPSSPILTRAIETELARMRGETGPAPEPMTGSLATDETQRRIVEETQFDNAMRENALLRAMDERRFLQMPPQQRAETQQEVPAQLQVLRALSPHIAALRQEQEEARQLHEAATAAGDQQAMQEAENGARLADQKIEDLMRAAGLRQF